MAYYYDKHRVAIYMTRSAYGILCKTCDAKLLRHTTVSDIRYDNKLRHIARRGYNCMLEIAPEYAARIRDIICANPDIYSATLNPCTYTVAPESIQCQCNAYHKDMVHNAKPITPACYKKLSTGNCGNVYLQQTVGNILYPNLYPKQKSR